MNDNVIWSVGICSDKAGNISELYTDGENHHYRENPKKVKIVGLSKDRENYVIWNKVDRIIAWHHPFMTKAEAQKQIENLIKMYEQQGYYSDCNHEHHDPKTVFEILTMTIDALDDNPPGPGNRLPFAIVGNEVIDAARDLGLSLVDHWDDKEHQGVKIVQLTSEEYKKLWNIAEETGGFVVRHHDPK